ncbi:DUF99 family protein [Pleionea sediminis]|uniref:endonuclease dU n=1 Tax=Pleionea sediminis TaxID=2569479 RepID=UPI001186BE20|nr:DUF99 family protein [Pleionea sediminis]
MSAKNNFDERISRKLERKKQLRVIGFDDAPFNKQLDHQVNISGIICSNTRFEGMLWNQITKDGDDATPQIINTLKASKFVEQLDAILLDGIAFGGFNIIDINEVSRSLNLPCITVMRRMPNFVKIKQALGHFTDTERRWQLIQSAGKVIEHSPFYFQPVGISESIASSILKQTTETGHVPEALRLAHLIGSAIKTGQSSNRA